MKDLITLVKEVYHLTGKNFLLEAFNPKSFVKYFKQEDGKMYNLANFELGSMPMEADREAALLKSQPGFPAAYPGGVILTSIRGGSEDTAPMKDATYTSYLNYFKSLPEDDTTGSEEPSTSGSQTDPTQVDYSQQSFNADDPNQKMFLEQEAEFAISDMEAKLRRSIDGREKAMIRQSMGVGDVRAPMWKVVFEGYAARMEQEANIVVADQLEFSKDIVNKVTDASLLANEIMLGVRDSKTLSKAELEKLRSFTIRKSNDGGLYLTKGLAADIAGELGIAEGKRYGLRVMKHGSESTETLKKIADKEGPDGKPLISSSKSEASAEKAMRAIVGVMFEFASDMQDSVDSGDSEELLKILKKISGKKDIVDLIALIHANQVEKIETIDAMGDGFMRIISEAARIHNVESPNASQTLAYLVGTVLQRNKSFKDALPEGTKIKQSGQAGSGIMKDGTILNADAVIKKNSDVAFNLRAKGINVNDESDIAVSMKYLHNMKGNIDLGMRDGSKIMARPAAVKMAQQTQAEALKNIATNLGIKVDEDFEEQTMQALQKETDSITKQMYAFEKDSLSRSRTKLKDRVSSESFERVKSMNIVVDALERFKKADPENPKEVKEARGRLETIITNNYRATTSTKDQRMLIANHFMTAGMSTDPNQIMLISTPDKSNLSMNEHDMGRVPAGIISGDIKLKFTGGGCSLVENGKNIGYVSYRFKDDRPKQGAGLSKKWFKKEAVTL